MNSKDIINKLFAIAEKQQKIIMKIAQTVSPFTGQMMSPPGSLEPTKTQKDSAGTFLAALPKGVASSAKESGSDMLLTFSPGQKTQKNYDAALATLQKLTNEGAIQQAFNLKVV